MGGQTGASRPSHLVALDSSLTSTETVRLVWDGEKGGRGYGVGGEGVYVPVATLSPRE